MKNIITLFLTIASVFSFSIPSAAQDKATTKITSVVQNDQNIVLTVSSSKPFYVGGNTHILHIGNKSFDIYQQSNDHGKGNLSFYIPADDFKTLKDGATVWLSYGHLLKEDAQEAEVVEACKQNPGACWQLGKFSKNLLTR